MSGKCLGCAADFSFFKKELGCKNCGGSFCKDCLKKKAPVPKRKNEVHKVCNKCHDILTGKAKPEDRSQYSPPEAYKKRMAALEGSQTSGVSKGASHPAPHKKYPKNMKKEDIQIAERLERLKESHKVEVPNQKEIEERMRKLKEPVVPVPSEAEVRQRLERLNQQPPSKGAVTQDSHPPQTSGGNLHQQPVVTASGRKLPPDEVHQLMGRMTELVNIDHKYNPTPDEDTLPVDTRKAPSKYGKTPAVQREEEEVARLIEQAKREAKLEKKRSEDGHKTDAQLRDRLQNLKGNPSRGSASHPTGTDSGWSAEAEEESEEVAAEKALKAILKADWSTGGTTSDDDTEAARIVEEAEDAPESDPEDQLPWCCICNSDATLRCYGCDGDLYCNRCYKEGHSREDYKDHKTRKFIPSTTSPDV